MKFAIFFMAEYAYVVAGSVLGATLFWEADPRRCRFCRSSVVGLVRGQDAQPGFRFPSLVLLDVPTWLRVDRVMDLCWKIFIPWTLINIPVIAGFAMLWKKPLMFWDLKKIFQIAWATMKGMLDHAQVLFYAGAHVPVSEMKRNRSLSVSEACCRFTRRFAFRARALCVRVCPSDVISMEWVRNEATKKKDLLWYQIDFAKCNRLPALPKRLARPKSNRSTTRTNTKRGVRGPEGISSVKWGLTYARHGRRGPCKALQEWYRFMPDGRREKIEKRRRPSRDTVDYFYFLAALVLAPALLVVTAHEERFPFGAVADRVFGGRGRNLRRCLRRRFSVRGSALGLHRRHLTVLLLFVVLLSGKPSDWAGRPGEREGVGRRALSRSFSWPRSAM